MKLEDPSPPPKTAEKLLKMFREKMPEFSVGLTDGSISIESVLVKVEGSEDEQKNVYVSWTNQDESLGRIVLEILQSIGQVP